MTKLFSQYVQAYPVCLTGMSSSVSRYPPNDNFSRLNTLIKSLLCVHSIAMECFFYNPCSVCCASSFPSFLSVPTKGLRARDPYPPYSRVQTRLSPYYTNSAAILIPLSPPPSLPPLSQPCKQRERERGGRGPTSQPTRRVRKGRREGRPSIRGTNKISGQEHFGRFMASGGRHTEKRGKKGLRENTFSALSLSLPSSPSSSFYPI